MHWINYHHLHYFWTTAKAGSVSEAARLLKLRQPTVSMQLKEFQLTIGHALFEKSGRKLLLTEVGKEVFAYAEKIFALGSELGDLLVHGVGKQTPVLRIGIADVISKVIAYKLIAPVLRMTPPINISCLEDKPERLVAELTLGNLDAVLSDKPMYQGSAGLHSRSLGSSSVSFFAAPLWAKKIKNFPEDLSKAPLLMTHAHTEVRHALDTWLKEKGIQPTVRGDFEDSALLKIFGEAGEGVFPAPTSISKQICRQFNVTKVGEVEEVIQSFYLTTIEKKISHRGLAALVETSKAML